MRFLLLMLFLLLGTGAYAKPYNGSGSEVILQGWHWKVYQMGGQWYRIMRENAGVIKGAGFDYVLFGPPSESTGDNPYLPTQWNNLNNGFGSKEQLRAAIQALKPSCGAICDIVVNHRCGKQTAGPDFFDPPFADNTKAVCRDDECGQGSGNFEEQHDQGEECEKQDGGRDLDHRNASVQNEVVKYEELLAGLGFRGWRYDVAKGFHGRHIGDYNDATAPAISIGEFFDGDTQKVVDWIDESGQRSMAFDFPTRFKLRDALRDGNYSLLKTQAGEAPGVIGMWPEMAVTWLENHDTEADRKNGNAFPEDKVMQGYCYILTHPGMPCVFWPHFFHRDPAQKAKLAKLIAVRKAAGIHSGSQLFIEPNTDGKYAAIVDDKVAVKIGPASWSPGPGWKVEVDGPDYAVWNRS